MTAGAIILGKDVASDRDLDPDFCIVGAGAGGSMAASVLAAAGASVVVLEEGGHHTRAEFKMQEAWSYPTLYQEHGNRTTDDLSILVLQGRSVGGGTTINWAAAFRPPARTIARWAERHDVRLDAATLAPHVRAVEERLGVAPAAPDDINRNNAILRDGAKRLGWQVEVAQRNVRNCVRLGACGLGCPVDAKQSALVTYVPDAIAAGATLYANASVDRLITDGARVTSVEASILDEALDRPAGARLRIRPRRGVVLAAGAINTPALLLRSNLPGAHGRTGRRTFLHPTVATLAIFPTPVEAYAGPPISISSQEFGDRGELLGYFLETPPIHPMLASIALPTFGTTHRRVLERLPFAQAVIALLVDGTQHDFKDPGGTVSVSAGGRTRLSYPVGELVMEGARDAVKSMARLQLAAGAQEVWTLHSDPIVLRSESHLAQLDAAPFGPNQHMLFSAHQMGGCPMGEDPARAVVNSRGRHHEIGNLWIADGSVFPTALGVNPQITIYALARLFAQDIAAQAS